MKILILLDGSRFSEDILGPAKKLTSQGGEAVEVHLVQVLDPEATQTTGMATPPASVELPGAWESVGGLYPLSDLSYGVTLETKDQALDRRYDEVMDYLRHISASHFDDTARTEVLFAKDVVEGIVEYAKSEKVDFIAIATHGRTGLSKVLLGSVAAGLLVANVAPLYMVRPDKIGKEGERADAGAENRPI